MLLRTSGLNCEAHASGEELLEALLPDARGVVVADYRLRGLHGLQVFHELQRRGFRIPVLLISGHADQHVIDVALADGVAEFLLKPTNPKELLSAIRRWLEPPPTVVNHDR